MESDTCEPKWSTATAIFKKLLLFFTIYIFGYYQLTLILPLIVIVLLVFNEKQDETKNTKLLIARTLAFGNEKEIILNSLENLPAWIKFPDIEKVEFLNRIFQQLWQNINTYAQNLVPQILEPIIQGYVSDFKFNRVILGNMPLRVDGVEIHDSSPNEIILDLNISYDGDCDVTFQTFKFTGGIKDIKLGGCLRVVLFPLISKMPLIGGVKLYFTKPPSIDFDLNRITQILDIPGVRNKIKSTTHDIINSILLYPNALSFNLSDGINMSKFFRIRGILRVHVVEAKNLVNKDLIGKSDPYVVLRCGTIRVETPVIQNSLNPKWDFWREFQIEQNAELYVEVWDKDDGSKDDSLGHARIDISQVAKVGSSYTPITLQGVEKGTLYLRLTWLSLSDNYNDLEATVKETSLLSSYLHTALLMLYIDSSSNLPPKTKAYLQIQVETQTKKTYPQTVSSGSVMWNEAFTFLLKDPRRALLNLNLMNDLSKNSLGEINFRVDSLKDESRMALKNHNFFLNKMQSGASISCSIKLRILKNNYVEETVEETKAVKIIKQTSSVSVKSNLSQSTIASESEQSETETTEEISNLGQIKISLSYSQQRQRLVVEIHQLNYFRKPSVEPYIRLILTTGEIKNNKKRTRALKNTTNPIVYEEKFEYLISSTDLAISTLTFQIKVREFLTSKLLGKTVILLSKCATLNEPFTDWFNLKTKKDDDVYEILK